MSQENYQGTKNEMYDLNYIYRCLIRNAVFILMLSCLAGTLSYIALQRYHSNTYTASVNLYVIPRDNAKGKFYSNNVDSAVSLCVNALNSDMMKEQIKKEENADRMRGNLSAESVSGTNIIVMRATASSAESACRLLKAGITNYPKLSGYFQTGYVLKKIGNITGNGITVNQEAALMNALKIALAVLVAGCALIVATAMFTDKLHSVEQAEHLLDMDVFGTIPYVRKKADQKAILITDTRVKSVYEEAIDKIVTKIRRKMHANGYKTLMISSVKENDGKSTVAVNVALNLAKRGKHVVLVDCDLRRPALYKIMEKDAKLQLQDYLEDRCTLDQVYEKIELEEKQLYAVFQKEAVRSPEKLLDSRVFKNMLKRLQDQFDYVILDTSPVGIVRDAEIIAGYADAVLVVMKQDEVHAVAVNDVIDVLDEAGSNVIGGVLNMEKGADLSGGGYYKYGSYYYGYGYGYGYGKEERNAAK